jgi:hypothetical protein
MPRDSFQPGLWEDRVFLLALGIGVEDDGDFHFRFGAFRSEQPLLHSLLRTIGEDRISSNDRGIADGSVGVNVHSQLYNPTDPTLLQYHRVLRSDFLQNFARGGGVLRQKRAGAEQAQQTARQALRQLIVISVSTHRQTLSPGPGRPENGNFALGRMGHGQGQSEMNLRGISKETIPASASCKPRIIGMLLESQFVMAIHARRFFCAQSHFVYQLETAPASG